MSSVLSHLSQGRGSFGTLLLVLAVIFGTPRTATAQVDSCWRCNGDPHQPGEESISCEDSWPSGAESCDWVVDEYCEESDNICSSQTDQDMQDALELAPEAILTLIDQYGSERAYAPVEPGVYMSWNCKGEVTSVMVQIEADQFLRSPVSSWGQEYSLQELSRIRFEAEESP